MPALALNVKEMEARPTFSGMFEQVLYQFPLREIRVAVPGWLNALDEGHWLVQHVLEHVTDAGAARSRCMRDHDGLCRGLCGFSPYTRGPAAATASSWAPGGVSFSLPLKDGLFNRILGEECGTDHPRATRIFLRLMKELVAAKSEYDHVADALEQRARRRATGWSPPR